MSKIILVTGGSRSGKSSFGEEMLKDKDKVLYIATSIITDDEMRERIP
ncbi:bifunctional adenosylcobinamide kinase/adenosylcobinamide-phosphate guanylyltransferase [Clostridium sp. YIM B02515]|uniref:Adenosylcobinamide kinase n=1 Tax=Clostridium rhizosphaerae TaxID=2803861 RepID=A0ABS1TA49_9CLOT|nr:bifunctional adenosylcobinamide kinase/adenosylcobinamide-phosphate guanylyltransferase [Clostridium rhizosphaerae]